jgi:acyl-coenzyme A synthetase/AMP-(fatty) acid ligase
LKLLKSTKLPILYGANRDQSFGKRKLRLHSKFPLASLKVIGSVGEPINEEAWHWYNDHVGDKRCPVVDTWWQTETGGIMISPPFVTPKTHLRHFTYQVYNLF